MLHYFNVPRFVAALVVVALVVKLFNVARSFYRSTLILRYSNVILF